jgi:hypothetical protein
VQVERRNRDVRQWSPTVRKALEQAEAMGLDPPRRPHDRLPELPDDLTGVSDRRLMDLLAQLTSWGGYSTVQLGLVAAEEKVLEQQIQQVEDRYVLTDEGKTNDLQRARKRQQSIRQQQQHLEAHALRKLLEGVTEELEDKTFAVSREITRRGIREPRERRDRRWNP